MSTILCCVPLAGAETVMTKRRSSAVGDGDGDGAGDGERLDNDNNNGFFSAEKTSFPVSPIKWHLLANCLCENNGNIFPSLHWVESKRDREHWLDWRIVCKDWISGRSSEQLDITRVKFGSEQAKAKANSLDAFKVPWFGVQVSRKYFQLLNSTKTGWIADSLAHHTGVILA